MTNWKNEELRATGTENGKQETGHGKRETQRRMGNNDQIEKWLSLNREQKLSEAKNMGWEKENQELQT